MGSQDDPERDGPIRRSELPTRPERAGDARAPGTQVDPASEACEEAELALAARQVRTLLSREADALADHLAGCARCKATAEAQSEDEWRWVARIPAGELSAGHVLPIVDPQVFVVERELASGGMGRVSLATDRRLGREVALKEILAPELRERFERETFITAHLQHPAIIPIYEAGTWPDGSAFYTMRLVEGTTLQGAIDAAKTLEARLALLHHMIATVEAMAYAHGRRIVHRDLKTTNVLVGAHGDTVVIDWGLAKRLDDSSTVDTNERTRVPDSVDLTRVGSVMGTPYFMAPEQARGEDCDERADVFALGAILYTLLAGQHPYYDPANRDPEGAISRVRTRSSRRSRPARRRSSARLLCWRGETRPGLMRGAGEPRENRGENRTGVDV